MVVTEALMVAVATIFAICSAIIWSYVSNKPLGMQTLLDSLMKDLILHSSLPNLYMLITGVLFNFFYPLNLTAGYIFVNSYYFVAHAFFASSLSFIIVKFTTIFHPSWIEDIQDSKVLKFVRLSVFLVSASFSILDVLFQNSGYGKITRLLTGNQAPNIEQGPRKGLLFLILANFSMLIYTYIKINQSYYSKNSCGISHEESFWSRLKRVWRGPEHQDNPSGGPYSLGALRVIGMAFIVAGGLGIGHMIYSKIQEEKVAYGFMPAMTIGNMFMFNIIPIIVIIKNPNMTNFVRTNILLKH